MAISETKMQIVIVNYFKDECDVNTSIKQAFEKGFRIGVKKGANTNRPQEWIPCKERLPREYEVLCCDIYKNYIVGHPFADDSASTGFCAESEGEFMYECVAWMPLPKPYEKRKESE